MDSHGETVSHSARPPAVVPWGFSAVGKWFLVIGLLCSAAPLRASEDLGGPTFDHAAETTYRQVTWADFKGKGVQPPGLSRRWDSGSFAHIATVLRLGRYEVTEQQVGEGWVAKAAGIRPYAVMDKNFSAVMPGSRNDYTLAHEQLHFDISEMIARRLAVELAGLEGVGPSAADARQDLAAEIRRRFEQGIQAHQDLQSRYDGETAHGQRKKQQKRWAAKVAEDFSSATQALEALRAASPESRSSGTEK